MLMRSNGGGGGDERFRSLYSRYYARMLRYFRRVFRVSEEDAQELTQDSFTRLWKMMDEYRGEAEWALLETIARNVGYNRVRSLTTIKRGAIRPESLHDPDSPRRDPEALQQDPLNRLIDAERRKRLFQAIESLPKGQRQCMQLWLEDYSYEKIGQLLRMTLDAVKSRIRDARRLLRERLGDEGVLPEE
jgi:RNA polymerase sigma-70 factor, ECF subfamily